MQIKQYQTFESGIMVRRQPLKALFRLLAKLVLFLVILFFLLLLVFRWAPIPTSALIHQQNALAEKSPKIYKPARYTWVSWDKISPNLALAVIAAEDQRFPKHWGIDTIEIKQALKDSRIDGKTPRGASTITQQVAKNLFLWNERSYTRKLLEIGLSITLELVWSKRRILEVYLNIAQFGNAIFGAEEASRQLFDKTPAELSIEEAAMLAAVLPKPAVYKVDKPTPHLLKKQQWILKQMKQLGGTNYLTKL